MIDQITHPFKGNWTIDLQNPIEVTITAHAFQIDLVVEQGGAKQEVRLPLSMCRDLLISLRNIYNAQPK